MEKKRVYEVAKEFHVSSEALISMLKDQKFSARSHMSVVDHKMYDSIKKQFEKQKTKALKDIKKKEKISEAIDKKSTSEEIKKTEPPKLKRKKKRPFKPIKHPENQLEKLIKIGGKKGKIKKEHLDVRKHRGKSRKHKRKIDTAAVQSSFKKTLASITTESKTKPKKFRSRHTQNVETEIKQVVKVSEFISVAELAAQIGVPANALIAKCLELGMMVSINQRLDMDSIILLSDEFGYAVEKLGEYAEDMLIARLEENDKNAQWVPRPPVVTVMGHVDHGKTTLLDYIRSESVVNTESGGITQHIGAYKVKLRNEKQITFIDTPGHQAFTAMRARGAQVTDIVILVVAADDSVMPQTIEAINHAKAALVPIIIAINKIDLKNADTEKLKSDLSRQNILVEDWGGSYQSQEISAKYGTNTYELLEKVLLEAEMLDLKAIDNRNANGIIIESHVDKGRGAIATVLVQNGTLRVKDPFIAGMASGSVRAMINDKGRRVEEAVPSEPVQILGFDSVPKAGDSFYVVKSEAEARGISNQRRIMKREQDYRRLKRVTLTDLYDQIREGSIKELKLIIKADVDGSVGALTDTLTQITHEEVRINVIHRGVGGINENDVLLATASGAIIIGFHVRPTPQAKSLAAKESVEIKLYNIIYNAVDDVKKALSGLLEPTITEKTTGTIEIRDVFKIPRIGNIAGSYIVSGTVKRGAKARLIRDNIVVYEGVISSLKRFKDDVTEVQQGYECGLNLEGYHDYKVGDTLEVFELIEESREI